LTVASCASLAAASRDVFFVPQEEVELVLLANDSQQPFVGVIQCVVYVPALDRLPV
jgi:hypothetical protein